MRIISVTISNNVSNFRRSNILMRSIPRSRQTRTALICKRASYKYIRFSSCGVYKDKTIAAAQSAIETGENLSISNPDK